MQRGWLVLPLLGLLAASTAQGASLELPFIEGLRRHGYYDYALLEIDRVEARKNLSPELRATLDFERAVTQLQYARSLVNPESQAKELDRAAKSLEQFTRLHADNPMVSKAYAERGQLLLDRARVELWQLHPDDPSAKQTAARTKAKKIIGEARGVFQISHDQAKAAYERFPKIPPSDPKVIEARRQAESSYLRAQLNLAVCTFEEGLTYEPKSSNRKKTLRKAADEFDKIHVNYRSQGAGLRAHLWQGKCFQEEGEPRKALGIYNELIRNDAPNETSRQIRAHATQFRLECLNEQADYTPVVKEVTDWLAALKKNIAPTTTDLGIRWQRAVAAEGLAAAKDTAPGDHERLVKLAAEDAQTVSRYPGEFQMLARAMMTRVGTPGGKKEDVHDFASGLNKARGNMEEIQGILEQMEAAGAEQKAKLQQQLHEKLQTAARQLHSLLAVAEPRTDKKELNRARYYLAFVDYELKENDESAILAEYASRRLTTLEPDLARDSARLALAAYEQEFNSRPDAQRVTMARIAQPVAEYLIRTWPEHDRANEARITMARLLDRSKQPLDAARWYAGVLESSDQYAEAQVGAGREY
jgi:cellulose synthase operon protein C